MEDLPAGFDEGRLLRALRDFGIVAATTSYSPVGFGDYHWSITGAGGQRWFATVSDLEHKEHCGQGSTAALEGLRRAMDTATTLRERDGLRFVAAPLRAPNGATVVPLDARYALSVFPFVPGVPGDFDQEQPPEERDQVLDLLAELHGRTPPDTTPVTVLDPPGRDRLEAALSESASARESGPFFELARELLADNAAAVRARFQDFDRLAEDVWRRGAPRVVTHGEPHPGNLLRRDDGYVLVDWDTVGLAVPERDLSVVSADPAALARYARVSGHTPDAAALELYALRWDLADLVEFVTWLWGPHSHTPDAEAARQGFTDTLARLVRPVTYGF